MTRFCYLLYGTASYPTRYQEESTGVTLAAVRILDD